MVGPNERSSNPMSEPTRTDQSDAEIEITLAREDMLLLSDGRSFDVREVLETDDGTVLSLTITLRGESAE